MAQVSFDQSHVHHCHIHGNQNGGYFIRPDAKEYFVAFYICPKRPAQIGLSLTDRHHLSREEAIEFAGGCTSSTTERAA